MYDVCHSASARGSRLKSFGINSRPLSLSLPPSLSPTPPSDSVLRVQRLLRFIGDDVWSQTCRRFSGGNGWIHDGLLPGIWPGHRRRTHLPLVGTFVIFDHPLPPPHSIRTPLFHASTMVENSKKHRQNSHPIIHCPKSERVSKVSAAEGASEASSSEQANE